VRARLGPVLGFLREQAADVIVFPEYAIPQGCLDVLREHADGRAIVAGLGYVRNRKLAEQLAALDPSFAVHEVERRNVAVVVAGDRVHLVTKRHRAKGERMEAGRGASVVEVPLAGGTVRLGVAICIDFLKEDHRLLEERADVACVPARTRDTGSFLGSPRDFPRVFANDAGTGRSTIVLPQIESPFTDRDKVRPAAGGVETVIVVEYHGYPQQPTPLGREPNRLVCRSEIVEDDDAERRRVLSEVGGLSTEDDESTILRIIAPRAGGRQHPHGPFGETLAEIRSLINHQHDLHGMLDFVTRCAVVPAGGRSAALRGRQAQWVLDRLHGMSRRPKGAGQAEDAYSDLIDDRTAATAPPRPRPEPPPVVAPPAAPARTAPPQPEPTPASPREPTPTAPPRPEPPPAVPPPAQPQPAVPPPAQPQPTRQAATAAETATQAQEPPLPDGAASLLLVETGGAAAARGLAVAVDDVALLPTALLSWEHPVPLRPVGADQPLAAEILWSRLGGAITALGLGSSGRRWPVPRWGRLVTAGADLPCAVLTSDGGRPWLVPGRLRGGAESYVLSAGGPVAAGSPVYSAGRCVGLVSTRDTVVLPATAVALPAWQAGVLPTRPVFDTVEFLRYEVPAPAGDEATGEGGHHLRAWAAATGFDVQPLPERDRGAVARRFAQRQRLAGWLVLRMSAAELLDHLALVLTSTAHVLVVVTDGAANGEELGRLPAAHPRRPGEPAVRVLLDG
jgi:hypothetical protein